MTIRYHTLTDATVVPDYVCQYQGIKTATPVCQFLPGAAVDAAVAGFVLATLTPLALEVALTVSDELIAQAERADTIRATGVQRAQRAADAASRRYLAVDPGNRLVADTLEADWNAALGDLATAQDDYTKARTDPAGLLTDAQRARIRALASDFPKLWNDPATPIRERKRLLRLLVSDVTLTRHDPTITVQLRLPGGQHHTLTIDIPPQRWHQHPTPAATLAVLDDLLEHSTTGQTAAALTARGLADGAGRPFTSDRVRYHCFHYKIPTRVERLRAKGLLSLTETAARFGVHPFTVKRWRKLGLLTAEQSSDAPAYMFHPDQPRPSLTEVWTAESADRHGTPSRHAQLHAAGLLTQDETAAQHGRHHRDDHPLAQARPAHRRADRAEGPMALPPPPAHPHPAPGPGRRSGSQGRAHQDLTRPPPLAASPTIRATKTVGGPRHDETQAPQQPITPPKPCRTRREGAV